MSSPENFDRDMTWIQGGTGHGALATSVPFTGNISCNTEGIIYPDVGRVSSSSRSDFTLGAGHWASHGIYMERPYDERAVYRVKGFMYSDDDDVSCCVSISVGSATPINGTEAFAYTRILSMSPRSIEFDHTFVIEKFGTIGGTDFSERDFMFAFSFVNRTASSVSAVCVDSCSVQRLSVVCPPYESARR